MKYLLVLVLLLVGCTQAVTPSSSPSGPSSATPESSPTCSPAGGEPRPCTPGEYADIEDQNRLIAQAEAVYRAYWKENVRLQKAGGTKSQTPALKRVLAQPALDQAMEVYRELKSDGARAVGGTWKLLKLTPQPTRTVEGSVTSLSVCWRTVGVSFVTARDKFPSGTVTVVESAFFKHVGHELMLFHVTSKKVSKC